MAQQFIDAAWHCGFQDYKITKDGAQAKMNGSSDILKYNVHSDTIRHSNRRGDGKRSGSIQQ